MKSVPCKRTFERVTDSNVADWFRSAWANRSAYPNEERCRRVAAMVNVVADVENASNQRMNLRLSLTEKRIICLNARKSARKFQRDLDLFLNILKYEEEMFRFAGRDESGFTFVTNKISTVQSVQQLIGLFLQECTPPRTEDHQDPILWIADCAKEAWRDANAGKQVPFGRKPDDSLVAFIRLALKGIGLAGNGLPGYSRETICDHLRGRHDRPRKR